VNSRPRETHIEYYRRYAIAPVRYDLSDMPAHLQRREALYNRLALPPLAFRGSRVLEVAAGTGQNSLYIAQLKPARLVLLEPNATAVEHLRRTYASCHVSHTAPEVVTCTLEEFEPVEPFDIVICENWLGNSTRDLELLEKLAGMVAPAGVLVITMVAPIGLVPNLLRRFLVPKLIGNGLDFEARSQLLAAAFTPHLRTLGAMTRSVIDWVQDNMLNPAYFGLCLSLPIVVERLGVHFDVLGCSPAFAEDWRWFKAMAGANRQINTHFLEEYWRKVHNYLDQCQQPFSREAEANQRLEEVALSLLAAIEGHEDSCLRGKNSLCAATQVQKLLERFVDSVPVQMSATMAALREFAERAFDIGSGDIDAVVGMECFGALFGRETSYLSLVRGAG
jgi:SAM-dependent methyltransferase